MSDLKHRKPKVAAEAVTPLIPGTPSHHSRRISKKESKSSQNINLSYLIISALVFWLSLAMTISFIATNTLTFGYDLPRVPSYQKVMSRLYPSQRVFKLEELQEYDGTDPSKPIYLGIFGKVYDVSKGRRFYAKPNGSYSMFSGTDAGRAFITGCFETHLTHDLRGLSEEQINSVKGWQDFYEKSNDYLFVGTIDYPPIDPDSPIPEDCNKNKS